MDSKTALDKKNLLSVYSEIGTLKKVLVHCPDRGIGGVLPDKAQEWLYEDIVHLKQMRKEFEVFKKILLAYLDPKQLKAWFEAEITFNDPERSLASAMCNQYIKSDYVVDIQDLLADILTDEKIRAEIVIAICALEDKTYQFQQTLMDVSLLSALELSKILITGHVDEPKKLGLKYAYVWPPAPNLLFTRDIGVTIGSQFLLSRTAAKTRKRESILSRYITYYYLLKNHPEDVVEIKPDSLAFLFNEKDSKDRHVTLEGGDVMTIAPKHLLIGCSERTTPYACQKIIAKLFKDDHSEIERISVINLPKKRAMMHLDTVLTQVDRGTWVLFKQLFEGESYQRDDEILLALGVDLHKYDDANIAKVTQFIKQKDQSYQVNPHIQTIKSLLLDISCRDYGCKEDEVTFIYSADGAMIDAEREQWTDSCNVVALKEGVVLGYDRNDKTALCFKQAGFELVDVSQLLLKLKEQWQLNQSIDIHSFLEKEVPQKALLLLPSAELSRARGGPHCMTMPIERDAVLGKPIGVEHAEAKSEIEA